MVIHPVTLEIAELAGDDRGRAGKAGREHDTFSPIEPMASFSDQRRAAFEPAEVACLPWNSPREGV
jgi:hypothetical protein